MLVCEVNICLTCSSYRGVAYHAPLLVRHGISFLVDIPLRRRDPVWSLDISGYPLLGLFVAHGAVVDGPLHDTLGDDVTQ